MRDYHDIYLQLDVLLLADFFEKFRRTCLDFYKLDPIHYYTTPGLAWDAALRMSRVDLELITNENIYNMVENIIRGGISMISTRHAKANNPRLPLYTQLGLKITKVHRVLTFKQSPWLKQYIDFNTRQRSLADSGFLKDFFKLMNNSVFGKTQENLRKRVQVDIVTVASLPRKTMAKPSFCRGIPITDDITVVQCKVQTLTLNRPIYVGFAVLELSKLHMYDFHFNHMKGKYHYADQLRPLFTDTDSLAYAVQTNDIYEDMAVDDNYDFSKFPLNYPLYNTSNKRTLGFFKDESNSVPMEEFVGLRPKCYAFRHSGKVDKNVVQHANPVEKKTAKGVKRKVKENHLHFQHYLDALKYVQSFVCKQNLITSTSHTVRTVHQRKVGLTAFDTKRWLCDDTIHTHSHGHYYASMVNSNTAFLGTMVVEAIKRLKPDC